jgi:hypothetical protein
MTAGFELKEKKTASDQPAVSSIFGGGGGRTPDLGYEPVGNMTRLRMCNWIR